MPRRTKTAPASLKGHPPILTVLEAAQLLRVSRSALYQQIREGRVPAMRVGHRMRISREVIERMLSERAAPRPDRERARRKAGGNVREIPAQGDGGGL
jgi:excisionase family DNA binding protein